MNRVLVSLFLSFFLGAPLACAQVVSEQPAAEAMKEIGESSWFDPEKQTIVPIPMRDTSSDDSHRESRWLPTAKKIAKQPASSSGLTGTGFSSNNLLGWLILGIGFVLIAGAILYAFSKLDPDGIAVLPGQRRSNSESMDSETMKRIQELPLELRRTDVDLRTEAERLMNLGQLDEAIKCLFGHQLITLDRRGFLRLSRGKTNGRYVAETRKDSIEAASLLKATVMAFEASYFGRHTPAMDLFRQLWQGNSRLESLVVQGSEVTA
jgi:hypothetical protein